MSQVLELCQIGEFEVERVNNEPSIKREWDNYDPQHCHCNVVEENQIVDDSEEQERKKSEANENTEAPQPWNNSRLVFLEELQSSV